MTERAKVGCPTERRGAIAVLCSGPGGRYNYQVHDGSGDSIPRSSLAAVKKNSYL
jgi:hypothetical protein